MLRIQAEQMHEWDLELERACRKRQGENFLEATVLTGWTLEHALVRAIKNERFLVIRTILNFKTPLRKNLSHAFRTACKFNCTRVIQTLLQYDDVDPGCKHNAALQWAVWNQNVAVVKTLLRDARVNPADANSYAVILAAETGCLATLKLLLGDDRVDPSTYCNAAIICAFERSFVDAVGLIAACRRFHYNPADFVEYVGLDAVVQEHLRWSGMRHAWIAASADREMKLSPRPRKRRRS